MIMYEPLHYDRPQPRYLRWVLILGLLGLLIAMGASGLAQQAINTNGTRAQGRQISLHQQLTAGLKATTKADKSFINRVVRDVDRGRLPRSLVDSTFLWSRQKADRKSYYRSLRPMVYFRPALVLRAKKIGIAL